MTLRHCEAVVLSTVTSIVQKGRSNLTDDTSTCFAQRQTLRKWNDEHFASLCAGCATQGTINSSTKADLKKLNPLFLRTYQTSL